MLVYSSKIIVNDCLSSGGARNGIQFWLSEWGWGMKNEHRGGGEFGHLCTDWTGDQIIRERLQGSWQSLLSRNRLVNIAGVTLEPPDLPPSPAPVVFPVEEGLDGAFHLQGGQQQYWGLEAQQTAWWLLDCQNNSRDSFSVTNYEEVLNAPYGIWHCLKKKKYMKWFTLPGSLL